MWLNSKKSTGQYERRHSKVSWEIASNREIDCFVLHRDKESEVTWQAFSLSPVVCKIDVEDHMTLSKPDSKSITTSSSSSRLQIHLAILP